MLNGKREPQSSWANVGLWNSLDDPYDYRKANRALARQLAEQASLQNCGTVLDLGFGMGEQIKFWFDSYAIDFCYGFNISSEQTNFAKQKLEAYSERIHLETGSHYKALDLDNKVDACVCLDCAYHFANFSEFVGDIRPLLTKRGRLSFHFMNVKNKSPFWLRALLKAGGIPKENYLTIEQLEQALKRQGFDNVQSIDLSCQVIPGFREFLKWFIKSNQARLSRSQLLRYRQTYWFLRLVATPYITYTLWSAENPD